MVYIYFISVELGLACLDQKALPEPLSVEQQE